MKNWWTLQSARINALSLRERVFLFLSVLACGMALVDVVWWSPAQVAHKQLTQRFEKQSAELKRVRDTVRTSATPVNVAQAASDESAGLKTSLDTVNQQINVLTSSASATPALAQVLSHLLRRHEGLTLVHTSVSPTDPNPQAPQANVTVPGALPAGLRRQEVVLTVSGPYPELIRYVQTLEAALPLVRWGGLQLKSEKSPPELTLHLFLIGLPT